MAGGGAPDAKTEPPSTKRSQLALPGAPLDLLIAEIITFDIGADVALSQLLYTSLTPILLSQDSTVVIMAPRVVFSNLYILEVLAVCDDFLHTL